MYFVYAVKCCDGTYYIGITNNLVKRIKAHNGEIAGGAKYTKGRRPIRLVYKEHILQKGNALKREIELKRLTRFEKEKLFS